MGRWIRSWLPFGSLINVDPDPQAAERELRRELAAGRGYRYQLGHGPEGADGWVYAAVPEDLLLKGEWDRGIDALRLGDKLIVNVEVEVGRIDVRLYESLLRAGVREGGPTVVDPADAPHVEHRRPARGRPPEISQVIKERMRRALDEGRVTPKALTAMKEDTVVADFGGSRKTAAKARKEALAEFDRATVHGSEPSNNPRTFRANRRKPSQSPK